MDFARAAFRTTHGVERLSDRQVYWPLFPRHDTYEPLSQTGPKEVGPIGLYSLSDVQLDQGLLLYNDNGMLDDPSIVPAYLRQPWGQLSHKPLRRLHRPVTFALSPSLIGYGHWWIDILPRVWLASKEEVNTKRPLLLPNTIPEFGKSLLSEIFPELECIHFDLERESLLLNDVMVPTLCHRDYLFHSAFLEFLYFVKTILNVPDTVESPGGRIFVSRSRYHGKSTGPAREIVNEPEVWSLLRHHGFQRVFNEELELRDKIGLYSNASLIVGEAGAALEHSMFMRPGGVVVSLGAVNDVQVQLARVGGHRIAFVDTQDWRCDQKLSRFVDVIGLTQALMRYAR